ncbi:MAG TPA: 4-alpha-glucanotransferase [Kofleriaceae bacterium]|nr:4-alpha-glucanotransferase [Kofleriaceae bacterium]
MLARLGIERLVLSIHQASFPASADDIGHGAPASRRGRDLLAWARGLGFTGIALGPAGITTRENPSPYDATIFSRNPLHVAFGAFGADVHAPAQRDHVDYAHAWDEAHRLLRGIEVSDDELALRREAMPWLAIEARYEGIAAIHGDDWRAWPLSPSEDAAAARAFEVGQLLADRDHAAFVAAAREHGLAVYADLPIGISHRDRWSLQDSFLPGYAMGAPPSRTNPDGQPWDFPVLDPRRDVSALIAARLDRALDGCAGLRIDHPHGWVCPWVYQRGGDVKLGARLYESPDLADHPALAAYARVRPDQIDRSRARHDDDWVRALEPAQVDAYAAIFDRLVARVGANDLMVEVLSTCPRPLAAVLARFGLGRFRITQKARVSVADDVYRSDNAQPADWIMVGNHDTPSLRAVIASWSADERERRARYLGARLRRPLRDDDRELATAMLADLFLGPARNVIIFWPDLFAIEEPFNRPGVISADNWRLRMPPDFERPRPPDVAPDLGTALTWAIAAR